MQHGAALKLGVIMAVSMDKTRISVTIDKMTYSLLSEIGRQKDRPMSYIVQQAVSFYLMKHPHARLITGKGMFEIIEALDDC